MTVYLLHFDRPYIPAGCEDDPRCWMQHYLGSTDDLDATMRIYRKGYGRIRHPANVVLVMRRAGIGFQLARTWEGGRGREHGLKRRKSGSWKPPGRLCPLCHPMPRINRWEGGQESPLCERIKARKIDPVTIDDPWAALPAVS